MRAESKVINAVCRNKDLVSVMTADIDDLFITHRDIWNGVKNYYSKHGSVPDASVVQEQFRDFDIEDVPGETTYYVDMLRDEYINSGIESILREELPQHGKIPAAHLLESLTQKLSALNKTATRVSDIDITDYEAAMRDMESKRKRAEEMGGSPGIPSGFKVMDTFFPTGMAGGHYIVLIGWSGRGKSWMANLLACKAWDAGFKPMIVSLEMTPEEQRERIYTIMGSGLFSNYDFGRGSVNIEQFESWGKNHLKNKHPFTIISSAGHSKISPGMIQTKIDKHRPDIVFVDYQQLLDDDEGNAQETQKNKNISRGLKRMATRNEIPVVNLTQATQNEVDDVNYPPQINQVAWSRSIEHDANLALAVHKYPNDPGEVSVFDIVCRKNRHGELFEFSLDWRINEGVVTERI